MYVPDVNNYIFILNQFYISNESKISHAPKDHQYLSLDRTTTTKIENIGRG